MITVNAGTAYAVFRALVLGEPLISRIVTVCGDTLQTPKNFEVLLGTPVAYLFELCGIDYQRLQRTVVGGSMMGITITDLAAPVTKTCNCLVAGSDEEFAPPPPALPCIRCGFCATACPASLQPQQLYLHARNGDLDRTRELGLDACIECGACAWVCPSHIPLVQFYRAAKTELQEREARHQLSQHWQQRYEFHQYRIARNEKRRLALKGARAQAAAAATPAATPSFDRNKARHDIAAAVARVKSRRKDLIASSTPRDTGEDEQP